MNRNNLTSEIKSITEHHHYPAWLLTHPDRINPYYTLLRIFYLRSRVCRRHLFQLLRGQNPGAAILDAGCGEGQFLIPAARRFPGLTFTGIDRLDHHIDFLHKLTEQEGLRNVRLQKGDIETGIISPVPADLIYTISVLQYTRDPARLIRRFHSIQPAGGILMIYTPAGPVFSFSFARKLKEKYSHYDAAQPFFHPVKEKELLQWISSAGYTILDKKYYYGRIASFSHEMIQSLVILITHWPPVFKIIPLIIMLLFSPIFVSLQVVDEIFRPRRGNGILLILQKK